MFFTQFTKEIADPQFTRTLIDNMTSKLNVLLVAPQKYDELATHATVITEDNLLSHEKEQILLKK